MPWVCAGCGHALGDHCELIHALFLAAGEQGVDEVEYGPCRVEGCVCEAPEPVEAVLGPLRRLH
jgi:hypothetical protein